MDGRDSGDHSTAASYKQTPLDNSILALRLKNSHGSNHCFANTALTMLLQIRVLWQFLEREGKSGGPITKELLRLKNRPNGTDDNIYALRVLVKRDGKSDFGDNLQHDASEFLTALISQVNDEVPGVADLFRGQIVIVRTCMKCRKQSKVIQTMDEIVMSVPISTLNREDRLSVLIENKFKDEQNVDKACECSPKENKPHTVSTSLKVAPKVMLVTTMRYMSTNKGISKLDNSIRVNMTHITTCATYILRSFINHEGKTTNSGHYTITVEEPSSQSFTELDDIKGFMQATKTGMQVLSSTKLEKSYVLCYLPERSDEPVLQTARAESVEEVKVKLTKEVEEKVEEEEEKVELLEGVKEEVNLEEVEVEEEEVEMEEVEEKMTPSRSDCVLCSLTQVHICKEDLVLEPQEEEEEEEEVEMEVTPSSLEEEEEEEVEMEVTPSSLEEEEEEEVKMEKEVTHSSLEEEEEEEVDMEEEVTPSSLEEEEEEEVKMENEVTPSSLKEEEEEEVKMEKEVTHSSLEEEEEEEVKMEKEVTHSSLEEEEEKEVEQMTNMFFEASKVVEKKKRRKVNRVMKEKKITQQPELQASPPSPNNPTRTTSRSNPTGPTSETNRRVHVCEHMKRVKSLKHGWIFDWQRTRDGQIYRLPGDQRAGYYRFLISGSVPPTCLCKTLIPTSSPLPSQQRAPTTPPQQTAMAAPIEEPHLATEGFVKQKGTRRVPLYNSKPPPVLNPGIYKRRQTSSKSLDPIRTAAISARKIAALRKRQMVIKKAKKQAARQLAKFSPQQEAPQINGTDLTQSPSADNDSMVERPKPKSKRSSKHQKSEEATHAIEANYEAITAKIQALTGFPWHKILTVYEFLQSLKEFTGCKCTKQMCALDLVRIQRKYLVITGKEKTLYLPRAIELHGGGGGGMEIIEEIVLQAKKKSAEMKKEAEMQKVEEEEEEERQKKEEDERQRLEQDQLKQDQLEHQQKKLQKRSKENTKLAKEEAEMQKKKNERQKQKQEQRQKKEKKVVQKTLPLLCSEENTARAEKESKKNEKGQQKYRPKVTVQECKTGSSPNQQELLKQRTVVVSEIHKMIQRQIAVNESASTVEKEMNNLISKNNLGVEVDHLTPSDGNCQFHTTIQQMNRRDLKKDFQNSGVYTKDYKELKQRLASFALDPNTVSPRMVELKRMHEYYHKIGQERESYKDYWTRMLKDKEWGDKTSIEVTAMYLQKDIHIISTDMSPGKPAHIISGNRDSLDGPPCDGPNLIFGYYKNVHYQSLLPVPGLNIMPEKGKDEQKANLGGADSPLDLATQSVIDSQSFKNVQDLPRLLSSSRKQVNAVNEGVYLTIHCRGYEIRQRPENTTEDKPMLSALTDVMKTEGKELNTSWIRKALSNKFEEYKACSGLQERSAPDVVQDINIELDAETGNSMFSSTKCDGTEKTFTRIPIQSNRTRCSVIYEVRKTLSNGNDFSTPPQAFLVDFQDKPQTVPDVTKPLTIGSNKYEAIGVIHNKMISLGYSDENRWYRLDKFNGSDSDWMKEYQLDKNNMQWKVTDMLGHTKHVLNDDIRAVLYKKNEGPESQSQRTGPNRQQQQQQQKSEDEERHILVHKIHQYQKATKDKLKMRLACTICYPDANNKNTFAVCPIHRPEPQNLESAKLFLKPDYQHLKDRQQLANLMHAKKIGETLRKYNHKANSDDQKTPVLSSTSHGGQIEVNTYAKHEGDAAITSDLKRLNDQMVINLIYGVSEENIAPMVKTVVSLDRPIAGAPEMPRYDVGYNEVFQFVCAQDKFTYEDGPRKLINGLYEHRTSQTGIVKPTIHFKRHPNYGNLMKINLKGINKHDDLKICAKMGYLYAASDETKVPGLIRFDHATATVGFDGYGFEEQGRYVRLAEYIMYDSASGHHIPGDGCKQANNKKYLLCDREGCSQKFWVMKATIHNVINKETRTVSEPVRSFQLTAVRRGDERVDMLCQSWNGPTLPENVKDAQRFGRLPDALQPHIEVGMTQVQKNKLEHTQRYHRSFNQSVQLPPLAEEGWKRDLLKQTEEDLDHLKLGNNRQSATSAAIQIAINATQVDFRLAFTAAVNKSPRDQTLRQLVDIFVEQNGGISDLLTVHPQTGECFITQTDMNKGTRNPINGPFNGFLLSSDDSLQQLRSDSAITNLVRENFVMEAINRPVRACGGCNRMPQPEVHRALPDIQLKKTTPGKSALIVADSVNAWVKEQDDESDCKYPTKFCNRPGACKVKDKYEVQRWPKNLLLSMAPSAKLGKAPTVSLDDFKGSVRLGNCDYTITGVVHETDDHLFKYQTSIRRGDKFIRCWQVNNGKTKFKEYRGHTQALNPDSMKQERMIVNSRVVSLLLVRNENREERNAPDLLTQAVTQSQSVNLVQGMPRLKNAIHSNSCFMNSAVLQTAHIQGDEIVVASRRPDGDEKVLTKALADIFICGEQQQPVEVTPVRNILMQEHPTGDYAPQLPGSVSRAFRHLQTRISAEIGGAKFSSEKANGERINFTSLDVHLEDRQGTVINLPNEVRIQSERMGLSKTPEMFVLDFNTYKQQTVEDATARVEILNDTFEPVSIAHYKRCHNWTSLRFKAPSGETSWFRVGDHSGVERLWAQRYHQQGNEQWQITGLSGNPKHALNSDVYSIVYRRVEQGQAEHSQPQPQEAPADQPMEEQAPAHQPMEEDIPEESIDRLGENHDFGFAQHQQEQQRERQREADHAKAQEARDRKRLYQEMSACSKCKVVLDGSNKMVEHLQTSRECTEAYIEKCLPTNRIRNAAYKEDSDRAIFHVAVMRDICVNRYCPQRRWLGDRFRDHYNDNADCLIAARESGVHFERWAMGDPDTTVGTLARLRRCLLDEIEVEETAADLFADGVRTKVMAPFEDQRYTKEQLVEELNHLETQCNDTYRMTAVEMASGSHTFIPSHLLQNPQEGNTIPVSLEGNKVLVPANKFAIPASHHNADVPLWNLRRRIRELRKATADQPTLVVQSEDAMSLVNRDWQLAFHDSRKRFFKAQGNGKGMGPIEEREPKRARVTELDPKWNETIDIALSATSPWSAAAKRERMEDMDAMCYCRGQSKIFVNMKVLDAFDGHREDLTSELARAAGMSLEHDGAPRKSNSIGFIQTHNRVRCKNGDVTCGEDCIFDHPSTEKWCYDNRDILKNEKFGPIILRHGSVVVKQFEKFLLKQGYQEYYLIPVFDPELLTLHLKGVVTHRNDDELNRRIAKNPQQVLHFDRAQEVIDRHADGINKTNTFPTVSISPGRLARNYRFADDIAEQIAAVASQEQISEEAKPLSVLAMWTPEDLPKTTDEERRLRQTLIQYATNTTLTNSLQLLDDMCRDNREDLDTLVQPPATCRQWNKIKNSLVYEHPEYLDLDQRTIELMEKYHYLMYKTANPNEFTYVRNWNELFIKPYNPHILQLTTLGMEVQPDVTGQLYGAHWPNEQQAPGISDEIAALLPEGEKHNWTTVSELEYMNTLSPHAIKPLRSRCSVVINTRQDKSVPFRPVNPDDVARGEDIYLSRIEGTEEEGEVDAAEDAEYVRPDGIEKLYEQRPGAAEGMCNAQVHTQYYKPDKTMNERGTYAAYRNECIANENNMASDGPYIMAGTEDMAPTAMRTTSDVILKQRERVCTHLNLIVRPHYNLDSRTEHHLYGTFRAAEQVNGIGSQEELEARKVRRERIFPLGVFPSSD